MAGAPACSAAPPESVSTVVAREEKWQGTLTAIGSVTAVQGVTVTPEIAGLVREIAFESGAVVSTSNLLVRLGIRLVNLGQYLETGKPIVSLQSLTPVYAEFSLPQQELARLKTGMRVHVTTDAYAARQFDGTLRS